MIDALGLDGVERVDDRGNAGLVNRCRHPEEVGIDRLLAAAGRAPVSVLDRLLDRYPAQMRGFFFGLAPPEYAETLYKSYGDPRQLGLSLSATFQ